MSALPECGGVPRELPTKWRLEAAKMRKLAGASQRRGELIEADVRFASAQDAEAYADELEAALQAESSTWEWDYGHLTQGCLDFPIWILWDNGNVDFVDEGATVDFTGCVGWMKAVRPMAPSMEPQS